MITVNFYNEDGAWLAKKSESSEDIPSGYTWDFSIYYGDEFKEDVSYISFEVKAKPYGI